MTRAYNQTPTCHPDRPHKGNGLCDRCYSNARYARNGKPWHNRRLRSNFGLTSAEYDAMLSEQGGVCRLCGGTNTDGRRLAVDHNHETGAIRGLLCGNCNRAIGLLRDSADLLRKAADYLDNVR